MSPLTLPVSKGDKPARLPALSPTLAHTVVITKVDGGLHSFLNLDGYLLYVGQRDSLLNTIGSANEKTFHVISNQGKSTVYIQIQLRWS